MEPAIVQTGLSSMSLNAYKSVVMVGRCQTNVMMEIRTVEMDAALYVKFKKTISVQEVLTQPLPNAFIQNSM